VPYPVQGHNDCDFSLAPKYVALDRTVIVKIALNNLWDHLDQFRNGTLRGLQRNRVRAKHLKFDHKIKIGILSEIRFRAVNIGSQQLITHRMLNPKGKIPQVINYKWKCNFCFPLFLQLMLIEMWSGGYVSLRIDIGMQSR